MDLIFPCPHCGQTSRATWSPGQATLYCSHCKRSLQAPSEAWQDGTLTRCLVCPSHELFVRKDFPQRLGVAIVVTGFALSSVAWYFYQPLWAFGVLFASALLDVLLYFSMGDAIQCYRCGAQYRGARDAEKYQPFDLETHERLRQEKLRLDEAAAARTATR